MKKAFITTIILFVASIGNAQKKQDLLNEIKKLRSLITTTETKVLKAEQNERLAKNKTAQLEAQIKEIKSENLGLLNTLNSFTAVSKKKSENVESTLQSLKQKDTQLKVINDALAKTNSTQLGVLTLFKNELSGFGKVEILKNQVVISIPNTSFFGTEDDKSIELSEKGTKILEKTSKILNEYTQLNIIIEGNNNAIEFKETSFKDNWDVSAAQAAAIIRSLQTQFTVDPKRMLIMGRSEYNTTTVEPNTRIIVDANFDVFYELVRNNMKN